MTRVLHILGGMGRGGAEAWTLELVAKASTDIEHSVVVFHGSGQELRADFGHAGARVVDLPEANSLAGLIGFWRYLRNHPYDVVHAHIQHASWMYFVVAGLQRVSTRLFTAHLDSRAEYASAGCLRRAYMRISARIILGFATDIHAVSDAAGSSLWGADWKSASHARVVHCGIDVDRFNPKPPSPSLVADLGMRGDEVVVLHVGRFAEQKNHDFLVRWFARFRERVPHSVLLLVGTGSLMERIRERVDSLGITESVRFLGGRSDVDELLRVAAVVLLPSIREGLPLVALEAQASGTPIVMSDAVTSEAVVSEFLTKRLSLEESMETWVSQTQTIIEQLTPEQASEGAASLIRSDFNIAVSVGEIEGTYRS